MKISDFIVNFFIDKGIIDVFGYPGGMVTHLMDSFEKYNKYIKVHVNYHEQASAFSACGYAQCSLKPGLAFATSGPGATNLITGICNAYFDSIPCVFITGQVNTYESKGDSLVRQKGFQETDIVSMVKNVTKDSIYINSSKELPEILYNLYCLSISGRPGPVLIDIPMNIQREEIEDEIAYFYIKKEVKKLNTKNIDDFQIEYITKSLKNSNRPCIIVGAGIRQSGQIEKFREIVNKFKIPVITSMVSIDVLERDNPYNYGFIGSYGNRVANFITSKSDLIISIGTRLDCRQTGNNLLFFAPNAKLIRIDIDSDEMTNKIKKNEVQYNIDLKDFLSYMKYMSFEGCHEKFLKWNEICLQISKYLKSMDELLPNNIIKRLSDLFPNECVITTDVGQNQVWVAQSINNKSTQKVLFSGGHGSMGYSLPAAIGAYYAVKLPIICIVGDGGIQMNIQELEFIRREKLPIKIILINNHSLGMIRHFQEMYFNSIFAQTIEEKGYSTPNFSKIALAYDLNYYNINNLDDINDNIKEILCNDIPQFIEIGIKQKTYVYPKLAINKPIEDQEPLMDRDLFETIKKL
ncbi:hypothetical protein HMPREF9629_01737 [Peptoanaerobacter stomatis]|uniref:Acetolactate synthase n=1 Tax=Peptoanaerobacter stomatis TaxID=796937 RepID=G9WZY1_9FIRM|nr:thiamine pyrophosphate-binding protein [Peptoanaerobacter stomatis]EHL15613.1 hypothetical protein HMPREF9629_01737 [Peptoanaerobacter stomatis]